MGKLAKPTHLEKWIFLISHNAFSIVLGVTTALHFVNITRPCHRVLLPLADYFFLLKSTRFVYFNFLNITLKFTPVETHSFYRFSLVIYHTCIVHFRMHSPSVEKPNFGENSTRLVNHHTLLLLIPSQISHRGCHRTSSLHFISSPFSSKFLPVLVVELPVIAPFSRRTALSSSHCAGWLTYRLSSVILLLHHPLVVSWRQLVLGRLSSCRSLVLLSP